MCESIVVVGAALSADVEAPTERFHSARLTRHGQSPKQPTNEEPKPFVWTKTADEIVASIARFAQRTVTAHAQ